MPRHFGQRLSATFVIFRASRPLNTLVLWNFIAMAIQVLPPQPEHATERRWPRYRIDVSVQLVTQGPAKVLIVQGRGSELNCGGMAVSSTVDLAIGAQVAVEFAYSGQPVRVRCFVRNRQHNRYGLEFVTENDSDYESVGQIESTLGKMGSAGSLES